MMNNRELVKAVFLGQKTERVPVGFWFHFLDDAETGDYMKTPDILERSLAGHQKFITDFRPDLVKIMSDGFFFYPIENPLNNIKDLSNIRVLESDHPWIAAQVELVKKVRAMDPGLFYFYNIFSPTTTLRFMVGLNKLLAWLSEDPALVSAALAKMGQGLAILAQKVIQESEADGIYLSVQNPNQDKISTDFYQSYLGPGELSVLDKAILVGGTNILHICGYAGVRNKLVNFADYQAKAFSWAVNVENVTLSEGKKIFGGRTVIGGFPNTSGSLIEKGERSEVVAFTKDLIRQAGELGLIIGADCTIPSSTSLEHLKWVREAAVL